MNKTILKTITPPLAVLLTTLLILTQTIPLTWESQDLGDVDSVAWSPDGTKIAAGAGSKVTVFSSSGEVLWEKDLGWSVSSVAWSPDGTKIAVGTGSGKIVVFSSSGSLLWESKYLDIDVDSVAWSPDGTKIAVGTWRRVIMLSSSGEVLWEKSLGGYVLSVAWSPDGTKIAAGTERENSKVFVFSSSDSKLWEKDLGWSVSSVAWSPDGTKLVAGAGNNKVTILSSSGSLLWESKYLGGWVDSVAWSPDGTKIATGTSGLTQGKVLVFSLSNVFGFCPLFPFVFVVPVGAVFGVGGFGFLFSAVLFIVSWRRFFGSFFGRGVGGGSAGGLGGVDFRSLLGEVVSVLRSSRDVSRASLLLSGIREFCSGSGSGSVVCGELGAVETLLETVSRVNELLAIGRDSSGSLGGRLRALEEAVSLCREHGIDCSDIEGVLRRVREEFSRVSGSVRDLVESARSLLSGGRALNALGRVSDALRLCDEAGIREVVEECSEAEKIRARIEAVKEFLESGIVIEVSRGATLVEGSPLVLEITARAPRSLHGPIEEVFVDFSAAREAGLLVQEGRVELPPIRPGDIITTRVEVLPTKAGVLKVPLRVCASGFLCISRSLELEAAPRLPEISEAGERIPVAEVSLADVYKFLRKSVPGLVKGYGCVEGYSPREVYLRPGIAPEGFEGSWTCCLLGCGGWGCAYLCRSGEREVVFKVPRGFEGIFEGGFIPTVHVKLLKKIRDEAEVLRRLKHPNVLKLLGVSRSAPLLAYEFAEGGSLYWQLSRGWTPSVRDVLLIGIQVGDALRYIHSRGLVHGDIKPGNVFIKGGVAKVGDFSTLVKLVTRTSTHSRFGYTPGFRAPEQAYADVRRRAFELGIESRTDVYQLGNLLLYLLTGDSLDGEEAVRPGAVEEATESVQNKALRNLLRKTLNPDPAKRPSTEDVVKQLLKILKSLDDTTQRRHERNSHI